ncbi:MAG: sigma-54-dependent Fis family transcriptional regulator [Nitrospirae bacterium]|nr:sigma-54-dependent Fis family transcriptional regulator [Nitrospirota bacterium]
MIKSKILVIDDEIGILRSLEMLLSKEGHEVTTASRGDIALSLISEKDFEVVFTDLKLPDMSGLDILTYAKDRIPSVQVIVITGFASIETAVEAIKRGAYDYLTKPLSSDKVRIITRRAIEAIALAKEIQHLRQELSQCFGFENLIGKSPKMQNVFKIIRQTAGSDSNVLITGDSGTGKELVARAIHYNSSRKNNRFVPINCGAISKELIEAELFGYVKGAFTGAVRDKTGFLELASGGTLFLDEIGETSSDFQVKLLRAIQEGEFNKVGSPYPTRVNVRVIAASNRNLEKAIADGNFRDDLFYRLNVISIHISPLSQRREDIPLLVLHFLEKYSKKRTDNKVKGITPSALEALINHNYPGNVRELENAIEYAVAFAHGNEITTDDLPSSIRKIRETTPKIHLKPFKAAKYEFERSFVLAAMKECGGNISRAAKMLDIHRQSLQQKIKELRIDFDLLKDK